MSKSLYSGAFLSVLALTILATPADATDFADVPPKPSVQSADTKKTTPNPSEGVGIETLALPVVSEEMSRLASELTMNFADDPSFASSEVPTTRDRVIVHWHGKESSELRKLISDHGTVPTEVRQTRFQPGFLRQRTEQLSKSNIDIKSYSINHDGSGIRVAVSQEAKNRKPMQELAKQYEEVVKAPVEIADASPEPAYSYTRQFDDYWHLGGARIYTFRPGSYNGCTSGFSVRQNGTGNQGTMFAAHCSLLGSQWSAWDGGPYYYPWGNVTVNDYPRDGAIIHSGTSYDYIWTSTWDSDVYTRINGASYAYVGQEICYSGSYSGLSCGNIVQNTSELYKFENYPTDITAFRTQQISNDPVVGKGDSGGPGYQLVSTSSGVKRLAVGIISAIPGGSGTDCQGVPGGNGRVCSATVFATSAQNIAAATGWYIPTS